MACVVSDLHAQTKFKHTLQVALEVPSHGLESYHFLLFLCSFDLYHRSR